MPGFAYSQKGRGFFKLNPSVQLWVITHPFSACRASKISDKALNMTMIVKDDPRLDGLENGGQVDAFRHAYWMALMSQQYNCRRAYRLGKAHEKGNVRDFRKGRLEEGELPDSVSVAMDLFNNCIGVTIGFENSEASENELAEIVIHKILAGEMRIIKRNAEGWFIDCDDQIIQPGEWLGIWQNSRCLVKSNNTLLEE
ncbi:MAG: DUF6973 domain-containing protein [Bacteroidia bacterium]